jgi:diadenosine tetraphosphate (Ap4A) HIT family hydrolase
MNVTMKKFGYPQTLIKEFKKCVIVLRPQQVTLGSLILICQDDAKAFSDISPEAFSELPQVIKEIESSLSKAFSYKKINYLMLMMVDPDVHFHVIPRYEETKSFSQHDFFDHGWPGTPDLKNPNETDPSLTIAILAHLKENWKKTIN